MLNNGQGWQAIWRVARIIWLPAGIAILVLAQLDGGLADGVVMSCTGFGEHAHCRWASAVQEPLYVQSMIEGWWCLLGISLVCCYLTYCRALRRSEKARSQ